MWHIWREMDKLEEGNIKLDWYFVTVFFSMCVFRCTSMSSIPVSHCLTQCNLGRTMQLLAMGFMGFIACGPLIFHLACWTLEKTLFSSLNENRRVLSLVSCMTTCGWKHPINLQQPPPPFKVQLLLKAIKLRICLSISSTHSNNMACTQYFGWNTPFPIAWNSFWTCKYVKNIATLQERQ